jgi:hypothetical protein
VRRKRYFVTNTSLTPLGDKPPADAPGPYHWRMVDPNSRVAAYLRHAQLRPTDVAPIEDGAVWVTEAEAEAEAARRGIPVELPDPLPPLTEAEARWTVRLLHKLGAHLIELQPGRKNPVETAWQQVAPLTEAEAVVWLVDGGNLGINLLRSGPNGWLVLDAEDAEATKLLVAAGLMPTAVTANAADSTSPKHGGCHVWLPLPAGTDPTPLKSTLQKNLPGGGLLDVLVGTRYVVGPGSVLDSAPGYRYEFDAGWLEAMRTDLSWAPVITELGAGNA